MNRVFVLKDVAYGAKVGGGVITGANELDELVVGAFAILNEKGAIVPAGILAVTDPVLLDSKTVQIAHNRAGTVQIVNLVPRKDLKALHRVNYRAAVKPVITLGGTSAALALTFTSVGEANIQIKDTSYSNSGNFGFKNVSVYKKSYMTNEETVDALVAKLNAEVTFITAAKVGGGTANMGITVTPKEDNVSIGASLSGMFEGNSIATTTAMVQSIGSYADILAMEKDASTEQGNSNFIDYTNEHYSQPFGADSTKNYDAITLHWEGTHATATNTKNVMFNNLTLAVESGAATLTTTAIMAILNPIFTAVFSTTSGAEGAADDGTDLDGVSGN